MGKPSPSMSEERRPSESISRPNSLLQSWMDAPESLLVARTEESAVLAGAVCSDDACRDNQCACDLMSGKARAPTACRHAVGPLVHSVMNTCPTSENVCFLKCVPNLLFSCHK